MDFKVDDMVRCIENEQYEHSLTKGNEYEIKEIEGHLLIILGDDGETTHALYTRFESVVEQQQTFDHPPKPKKDWYNQWIIEDNAHKKKIHDACMALKERRLKKDK